MGPRATVRARRASLPARTGTVAVAVLRAVFPVAGPCARASRPFGVPAAPAGPAAGDRDRHEAGRHRLDLACTGDSWFEASDPTLVVHVLARDSSPLVLAGPREEDLPRFAGTAVEVELAALPPLGGVVGIRPVDVPTGSVLG